MHGFEYSLDAVHVPYWMPSAIRSGHSGIPGWLILLIAGIAVVAVVVVVFIALVIVGGARGRSKADRQFYGSDHHQLTDRPSGTTQPPDPDSRPHHSDPGDDPPQ